MTTALTLIDWLSVGVLWTLVSIPLGAVVGHWLARGSGQWLLDSWAEDEEHRAV